MIENKKYKAPIGVEADLPTSEDQGILLVTSDTDGMFIAQGNGIVPRRIKGTSLKVGTKILTTGTIELIAGNNVILEMDEDNKKIVMTAMTGNVIGFFNTVPVAKQVVSLQGVDTDIGSLQFSASPTKAECEALRDQCKVIADNTKRIYTALAAYGLF